MIQRLSHVTLFVNNQDEAKDFYVNKLGFEVRTDHTMDNGFRWLTVGPKTQPELEIVLMEPKAGPMFDEEAAQASGCCSRKACSARRVPGRRLPQDLRGAEEKGVQFAGAPEERFYGVEAIMKDGSATGSA